MLRIQLPERSSFRFGRKSYIVDEKDKLNALEESDSEPKIPPPIPLPLVHHTSTKSLFDLFQPQNESAYGIQSKKNENMAILNPLSAKSAPDNLLKPFLENRSVSPFDALGSHGDATSTSSKPTTTLLVVPPLVLEHDQSTASTPSSGFREDDDASGCSRKSSTSSVGTPLAGHRAYFEAMAALEKETGVVEIPLSDTTHLIPPQEPEAILTRAAPQYDKPLPPPPPPSLERPFSVSSVLSITRAESSSKVAERPSMQMMADAPIVFRRQSQLKQSHGRSLSESALCSKKSTSFRVKSPSTSPRSKRGARLGVAMSQRHAHIRAQTMSNITVLPPGSSRPARPRPLSSSFDNMSMPIDLKEKAVRLDRFAEQPPISVSPSAAEKVVFEIMRRLDDPMDLLSAAQVSRGFRETFKRGEPRLVHELLLRQCPAAWEFQKNNAQASGRPLSLRAYTKDKATLTFIKSGLLTSCETALKPETMAGLTGADIGRQARIDSALWRIWTFCKGFGPRSLSGEDLAIQADWLNGGRIARKRHIKTAVGRGNGKGLSVTDLEDLLEMWDGLGETLSKLKCNVTEARAAGIFDRCTIDRNHTEEWFLEEWTYYIRSLGLPVMPSVSSMNSFEQVKASGFTDWTPPVHGQTRASFFRAAVMSVYQERVLADATANAARTALPPRSQHRPTVSDASISSLEQLERALERHAARPQTLKLNTNSIEIRRKPLSPTLIVESSKPNTTWQPETPDTPYPKQSDGERQAGFDQQEREHDMQRDSMRDSLILPIRNSLALQSLGMTPTASTRLGATLFPMEYPRTSQTPVLSPVSPLSATPSSARRFTPPSDDLPAVIDPVDKAMKLLTQDMGFSIAEASRALAKCDTGFGIDVQKAIEMLAYESGRTLSAAPPQQTQVTTPTPAPASAIPAQPSAPSSPVKLRTPRESCTGHHSRSGSSDSNSTPSTAIEPKPFEPLCDTYPVRQPSLLGNLNLNLHRNSLNIKSLSRMTSKAKARAFNTNKAPPTSNEESRAPRISPFKAMHGSVPYPAWHSQPQSSAAEQRPRSKMPPRKERKANLSGIDEEPSGKVMRLLGVDELEVQSPEAAKARAKGGKRFYEGRFGGLGWGDGGSVK